MLISTKGHKDHHMGVDMNMEHIVNFQKVFKLKKHLQYSH